MSIYIYKHPDTNEHREVFQGMNDEHIFIDEFGVQWRRVYLAPNASIDSSIDPFNKQQYIDATYHKKGTVGDMMDYSAELSSKRAEQAGGVDPVKEKFYNNYANERNGTDHPNRIKEKGNQSNQVNVDYD